MDRTRAVRGEEHDRRGQILRRHPAARVRVGHRGAVLGSVDDGGKHTVDVDVLLAQLGGHRLGDPDHCAFRGDIRSHPRCTLLRSVGADVDDLAAARFEHVRHDRPRRMQHAARVEVEEEIPVGVGSLVHRRAHAEASGEVAQHVDALEALHRLSGRGIQFFLALEVGRQQKLPHILGVESAREAFLPQIHERQVGPEVGKGLGYGASEITGCARDHYRPVGEAHVISFLLEGESRQEFM